MTTREATKRLKKFYTTHSRLPSYEEMCDIFGFTSEETWTEIVDKLITAGIIARDAEGKLVPKQLFDLPLVGSIKAGVPTSAEQQLLDTLSIHRFLVEHPDESLLLRVSGDSMIDAGIHDGDLVVVEKGKSPRNGDIVVANIDNDWTLKYYQNQKGLISLIPANKKYSSLYPKESLTIFGVVVSVMRKF